MYSSRDGFKSRKRNKKKVEKSSKKKKNNQKLLDIIIVIVDSIHSLLHFIRVFVFVLSLSLSLLLAPERLLASASTEAQRSHIYQNLIPCAATINYYTNLCRERTAVHNGLRAYRDR